MHVPVPKPFACALLASLALQFAAAAAAQEVPRAYQASPEVYKVVAENAQKRMLVATWKPGQRDVMHSHPSAAIYFLTDCLARVHLPDGSFRDGQPRAGGAVLQDAVAAHSFENIGTSECRMLIVEGP